MISTEGEFPGRGGRGINLTYSIASLCIVSTR